MPLPTIFGNSVADGRNKFTSNDLEPIEMKIKDEILMTQADDMDNTFEDETNGVDVYVANVRKQHQISFKATSHHIARNQSNLFCQASEPLSLNTLKPRLTHITLISLCMMESRYKDDMLIQLMVEQCKEE